MSLVLRSLSTTTRLKLSSTAGRKAASRSAGATAASVATKASIVAIRGSIMPDPLAMPPMAIRRPSASKATAACLGTVSVVMMAVAASAPPSGERAAAARRAPLAIASIGTRMPMIPVELTSTSSSAMPSVAATSRDMTRASSMPAWPVQALA